MFPATSITSEFPCEPARVFFGSTSVGPLLFLIGTRCFENHPSNSRVRILVKVSLCLFAFLLASITLAERPATFDAITFADQKGEMYLPARDISEILGWRLSTGKDHKTIYLNNKPVQTRIRKDAFGSALISLQELRRRGVSISTSNHGKVAKVRIKRRLFIARVGEKRVVINKSHLQLRAWQGSRVVLESPVTIGMEGKSTPSGLFKAEGGKEKMHRSKLYHDAPMPYSVHVVGNVFIHGWPRVSGRLGSHGCIRLPIPKARFFYYWVQSGTPVTITGSWPKGAKK